MTDVSTVVALISGGIESAVLAAIASRDYAFRHAMHVSYGQNAYEQELAAARYFCRKYALHLEIVTIDMPFWVSPMCGGHITADLTGSPSRSHIIHSRNTVLLSIAAAYADSIDGNCHILAGFDHRTDNPGAANDKSPRFVSAIDTAIELGAENSNISIRCPLQGFKKSDTIALGTRLGVDFSRTWSCYNNGDFQCGECGSCLEVKRGFNDANIQCQIEYEDLND